MSSVRVPPKEFPSDHARTCIYNIRHLSRSFVRYFDSHPVRGRSPSPVPLSRRRGLCSTAGHRGHRRCLHQRGRCRRRCIFHVDHYGRVDARVRVSTPDHLGARRRCDPCSHPACGITRPERVVVRSRAGYYAWALHPTLPGAEDRKHPVMRHELRLRQGHAHLTVVCRIRRFAEDLEPELRTLELVVEGATVQASQQQ